MAKLMNGYQVEGDEIQEITNGRVTASWKIKELNKSTRWQLYQKGDDEVKKALEEQKPETVKKVIAKKKPKKKATK